MPITPFPQFKKYPEVKGVFIGGCVERGDGSSFRAKAHAHFAGDYKGWICLRSAKRLYTATGVPSNLMLHELAHVLTNKGHVQEWADTARKLGCKIPKGRYRFIN